MECNHCGVAVENPKRYCPHCTRILADYIYCDACQEPIFNAAKTCRYCGAANKVLKERQAADLTIEVTAEPLGAFITTGVLTALFKPPVILVKDGKVHTTKWTFFGLRVHHTEMEFTRIASVRHTKGIFWSSILFETFGGASEDMTQNGLAHSDAQAMASKLKEIIAQ